MAPKTVRLAAAVRAWLLAASLAAAEADEPAATRHAWTASLAAAKAESIRRGGTPILAFFLGGEGCPWSRRLKAEVLDAKGFAARAAARFVLLRIDAPDIGALPPAVRDLLSACGVNGFPSALILAPSGKVVARAGYRTGGADAFLAHMEGLWTAADSR